MPTPHDEHARLNRIDWAWFGAVGVLLTLLGVGIAHAATPSISPTRTSEYAWQCQNADGSKISNHQTDLEAIAACANLSFKDGIARFIAGGKWRVDTKFDGPAPLPVDAVMSAWGPWVDGMSSTCTANVQTVAQSRTRTVVTPAKNGGNTGALSESQQIAKPCPSPPTGPAKPIAAAPNPSPYTTLRVRGGAEVIQPRNSTTGGEFRLPCNYSHMAFDDPIVFPGQPGASHLHMFFGNSSTNANSTTESLKAANSSTCAGGTANLTSYWMPALIDTTTNKAIAPYDGGIYYKVAPYILSKVVVAPPEGLRMIAGNPPTQTVENPSYPYYYWECSTADDSRSKRGQAIPDCPVGDDLVISAGFPSCWDGRNLDSPDHRSHMKYPEFACPTSHPVAIPEITYIVKYKVNGSTKNLKLSSDTGTRGVSAHADVWLAWNPDISAVWIKNCLNASADCHSWLLGDGRTLY